MGFHLLNHLYSLCGANAHIALMDDLRVVYRNWVVETLLLLAVGIQIISGIKLAAEKRKSASGFFEKLQIWTGLYLALFLVIHVSSVLMGRLVLHLDTNFYFGVAGLNTFPLSLFFFPYYGLAVLSFFGHVAAIHAKKMSRNIMGIRPINQSFIIVGLGLLSTLVMLYGLTNGFKGVTIPKAYGVLTGQ